MRLVGSVQAVRDFLRSLFRSFNEEIVEKILSFPGSRGVAKGVLHAKNKYAHFILAWKREVGRIWVFLVYSEVRRPSQKEDRVEFSKGTDELVYLCDRHKPVCQLDGAPEDDVADKIARLSERFLKAKGLCVPEDVQCLFEYDADLEAAFVQAEKNRIFFVTKEDVHEVDSSYALPLRNWIFLGLQKAGVQKSAKEITKEDVKLAIAGHVAHALAGFEGRR